MKITEQCIEGLFLIEGLSFSDNRGALLKPFSKSFFGEMYPQINLNIKEVWFTKSERNVIRAMHLQTGEKACEKIVSVINGAVIDVILDLRPQSISYRQWFEIELTDKNSQSLYIPIGCAHGYKVLADNTITMYLATEVFDPKNDTGIRWDSFGYDWGVENPILSEKDLLLKPMTEFRLS
jgi:dTDP-4-dehydrorhamnose 3,5-epimerase/CDP-3, 6-dideoxy-D-glycero-D-glycero-4-hexulose-5-epimerase